MTPDALFARSSIKIPALPLDALQHGEVFTRRWVVETMLDLVEYRAERDLANMVLVEPACGEGAFLGPIAERVSQSCRSHGRSLLEAANAVRAFDLLEHNVTASRELVTHLLLADGWDPADVGKVVHTWISQSDYLLLDHDDEDVDVVIGNPPYIRLEDVPDPRMKAYRLACSTMSGRADIYVGFYERGLRSLKPGGRLAFICADRWMRNQYGRKLRQLIADHYSVELVLTMHDVDAFHEKVSAYPAITVIQNSSQSEAVAADTNREFGPRQANEFLKWFENKEKTLEQRPSFHAARLPKWFPGDDSWPAASPTRLMVLEELCDRFPLLEETGVRVGIGIATGADSVFIAHEDALPDVEEDRLLPLAMVQDTTSGKLKWHGTYLVNPWDKEGNLVNLTQYPGLARYYKKNSSILKKRYVATKQPHRWYKTIDKVNHQLTGREKLYLPDMKTTIHPVLDSGHYYPHHNLYYIVSDKWDMRTLGGLLLSRIAEAFVSAYAVKMRGGTLRFQAQYLRKIRVPDPGSISQDDRDALADAFERRDADAATSAALRAYGLSKFPD